jgi:pilus assembly protein Flp/PilA
MKHMKQMLINLWRDDAGQDLTEYALLLVLIALAAVTATKTLANSITSVFNNASSNLNTATT